MTRRPFNPNEADMPARDVEPTVADMERYLADSAATRPRLRRSRDA